ncbi:hypothetical protein [Aestuariibius sp. HNIBRBA575]|uniref:hypothetical protein n=1 Tax=Aestuariibius sp. HNIBRBA575 TaxID=3233343 RepID=UPI0034A4C8E4
MDYTANGGFEPSLPIFCDAAKVGFWAGEAKKDVAGKDLPMLSVEACQPWPS